MDEDPRFVVKTRTEVVTGKQLLIIAVVSALVIAFLCVFLSIPLTIGVVKTGIVADPPTKSGQMKLLGMVYAISWAACYVGFMLKFFWNFHKAYKGVENTKFEGEYSFFDDHLEAQLDGNHRRMRYLDMLTVENRNDEAFAFIGRNAIGTGTEKIAFGLSKPEMNLKKGVNYWMHLRTLIEKRNPSCEFLNVVKGSKSIDKKKKKVGDRRKAESGASNQKNLTERVSRLNQKNNRKN